MSLAVQPQECLALVGESGSRQDHPGALYLRPAPGLLRADHVAEASAPARDAGALDPETRQKIQYVFQSPYSSLNPRRTVGTDRRPAAERLLQAPERREVDAPHRRAVLKNEWRSAASVVDRYTDQLSGRRKAAGRHRARSRVQAVASDLRRGHVGAQRLRPGRDRPAAWGLSSGRWASTMLFVTHNLPLVRAIAHRIVVMSDGRIVETAPADQGARRPRGGIHARAACGDSRAGYGRGHGNGVPRGADVVDERPAQGAPGRPGLRPRPPSREQAQRPLPPRSSQALLEALEGEEVRESAVGRCHRSGTSLFGGCRCQRAQGRQPRGRCRLLPGERVRLRAGRRIAAAVLIAVHGYCLGGGLELALASDFRVADETALFGLPEVAIGIVPSSGGPFRLTRLVGPARPRSSCCCGHGWAPRGAGARGRDRGRGGGRGARAGARAGRGAWPTCRRSRSRSPGGRRGGRGSSRDASC